MTKVKLCGLMSAEDAEYCNAVFPDLAGMILTPGFRRSVSPETAKEIRRTLHADIPLTGVFVNAKPDEITAFADCGIIQIVQLHGNEDAAYIRNLRMVCTLPMIKAYRIAAPEDLQRAAESEADIVLLDSGTGTGKTFDHSLLGRFPRPYLLAGGLSPDNVAKAIAAHHPYGVDVSSGIETEGRKDAEKMQAFIQAVRACT